MLFELLFWEQAHREQDTPLVGDRVLIQKFLFITILLEPVTQMTNSFVLRQFLAYVVKSGLELNNRAPPSRVLGSQVCYQICLDYSFANVGGTSFPQSGLVYTGVAHRTTSHLLFETGSHGGPS